ncbi:hypothetical protein ABT301_34305 [Streptomyces sp. NPDC000987]|uniref:hypothetical protein n=1 Tax=Streptomyces sp. NPDC000987 TaxID=3154374 RepID=UPI0033233373
MSAFDASADGEGAESEEGGDATVTWKKTFGHHSLVAFVDHGQAGSGEPVAALLRPGNAGSVRHEVAQFEWLHRMEVRLMSKV